MKQLRLILEKLTDGQKVRGLSLSLSDIQELIRIYNSKVRGEEPEFINGRVKDVLDSCKIKTVACGIGWKCV